MPKDKSNVSLKTISKKAVIPALTAVLLLSWNTPANDAALQGSDTLYHDISYEEELAEAVSVLSLGDTTHVISNLVLPYSYGIHINISWESSDEAVIDTKGRVTTPTDTDKDVTLTASLSSTRLDTVEKKEFQVHVPRASAEDVLKQDAKTAQEYIDYILNTGYLLPDPEELGIRSDISWELTAGEAAIKNGRLIKTAQSAERQPIELSAVLSWEGKKEEIQLKHITLIDEYAAYILSYFAGKKESKEMYLGYSYDGIHWMRLNSADAVLTPKKGNRQIRDPFIMRKKDGSFAVFATNGWRSPMITIWDSENLESFENERLCKLTEPGGVPSGVYTWAPECNYDPLTDQYYVYWSDPEAHHQAGQIYYNTSTDLENFSPSGLFFEREFFIIDASIKKYKGDYYMLYDDGTGDNDTGNGGRRIYAAKADSLEPGAFRPYSGVLSEGVAEGPFLLQNFRDGSWFAYYDYYSEHKFGLTTIEDITGDDWEYQGISETMPWEELRHGGALPVTQKELDRILAAWAKDDPDLLHITDPQPLTAEAGSNASSLKLPETVSALLSDGNIIELPVTWDTADVSLEKEGTLTLTGSLEKGKYPYNDPEGSQPKLTLTVTASPSYLPWIGAAAGVLLIFTAFLFLLRKKQRQKAA